MSGRYFIESASFEVPRIGGRTQHECRVFCDDFVAVATGIGATPGEATQRAEQIASLLDAFEGSPSALRAAFDAGQDAEDEMEKQAGYPVVLKRLDAGDASDTTETLLKACDIRALALGFGQLPISVRWPMILRRVRARST